MEKRRIRLPVAQAFALAVSAVSLIYCGNLSAQGSVASILQRSVEANNRDWTAVFQFDNSERDRNKDGDNTYAVTMLYGSPYQRLIAVNGQALSPDKGKEEQRKFERAVEERKHESQDKRAARIVKYEAERKRDRTMLDQMTAAFDFHMVGEEQVDGRRVYELKATPRKGYRPPNRDSQVLTGMEGTLWIDCNTYQWVKVEAHVTHPVRIVGFLAQVEPGTRFELEKKPVPGNENIWMAAHFTMRSRARVMWLIPHHGEEDVMFFNYHKHADVTESARSQVLSRKPGRMRERHSGARNVSRAKKSPSLLVLQRPVRDTILWQRTRLPRKPSFSDLISAFLPLG